MQTTPIQNLFLGQPDNLNNHSLVLVDGSLLPAHYIGSMIPVLGFDIGLM